MAVSVILLIILLILVFVFLLQTNITRIEGGGEKHGNIVVDTLNINYALFRKADLEHIIKTIYFISNLLQNKYTDRVMFVIKDQIIKNHSEDEKKQFNNVAKELKIYIFLTEQYEDIHRVNQKEAKKTHSANGRDDFYMCVLANKYNCKILTNDKLRDYSEFAKTVKPFRIIEYNYWRDGFIEDFISPVGFRIRRPKTLKLKGLLLDTGIVN